MIEHDYEPARGALILWRLSPQTEAQFCDLLDRLEEEEAMSDDYRAIVEEIRCLPGFPAEADPNHDIIIREVYAVPTSRLAGSH